MPMAFPSALTQGGVMFDCRAVSVEPRVEAREHLDEAATVSDVPSGHLNVMPLRREPA